MRIEKVDIKSVKKNPNNPRVIKDDKFFKLVRSIKEFPQMLEIRPIVINSDWFVLGGNMRLAACIEAGLTEVFIIRAENLTEEQQKEFIIKDNVSFGDWDFSHIEDIYKFDELDKWGLEIPEIKNLNKKKNDSVVDDKYIIPEKIKTNVNLGDVFQIGSHRLMCGDSTSFSDVSRLMDNGIAEILFTSPPYSDMREYNGNKDLSVSNLIKFIPAYYEFAKYQIINLGIQRKDHEIFQYWNDYISIAKDSGYKFLSWNIWDRMKAGTLSQQTAMFAIRHEWIFVFGKEYKRLNRTIPNDIEKYEKRHGKNWMDGKISKVREGDVLVKHGVPTYTHHQLETVQQIYPYMARDENVKHPAMFPIELPGEYIKAMTKENDIVIDSFLGSGTVMVACHQLDRNCYGMELDPNYCQVVLNRMKAFDDSIVIKRNGSEYYFPE